MRRTNLHGYAFVAFPMAILLAFSLAPTAVGLVLSLCNWDGAWGAEYVGLTNFVSLLGRDEKFWPALVNTLVFVGATVPATMAAGFILAVALHAKWFRGAGVVRTIVFVPTVLSIVAIGFIWRWVLDTHVGLLTFVVKQATGSAVQMPGWLTDGYWPLFWIVVVSIWRGVGFCMVLYLAALANVPQSLYEAAELDGARRGQILRHITWPMVAPTTVFLGVTGVIGALQVFDIVFVMTAPQETNANNVLNLYLYRQFGQGNFGYAAAIGAVIFVITMAATALQLLAAGRAQR